MTDTNTVRFHRVLRAAPDLVFRAFVTPEAVAKWLPPNGFVCKVHHLEPQVGGTFRMSFVQLASGDEHAFGGQYLEIEPGRRLRYSDVFDDPNLPGTLVTTIDLTPVSCGTELHIVQEGIPAAIPTEMCMLGWQDSLRLLALLVEGP